MKTREAVYKWRICWKTKSTNKIVYVKQQFDTFEGANKYSKELDEQWHGAYQHWVEKVEVKEQPKEMA